MHIDKSKCCRKESPPETPVQLAPGPCNPWVWAVSPDALWAGRHGARTPARGPYGPGAGPPCILEGGLSREVWWPLAPFSLRAFSEVSSTSPWPELGHMPTRPPHPQGSSVPTQESVPRRGERLVGAAASRPGHYRLTLFVSHSAVVW